MRGLVPRWRRTAGVRDGLRRPWVAADNAALRRAEWLRGASAMRRMAPRRLMSCNGCASIRDARRWQRPVEWSSGPRRHRTGTVGTAAAAGRCGMRGEGTAERWDAEASAGPGPGVRGVGSEMHGNGVRRLRTARHGGAAARRSLAPDRAARRRRSRDLHWTASQRRRTAEQGVATGRASRRVAWRRRCGTEDRRARRRLWAAECGSAEPSKATAQGCFAGFSGARRSDGSAQSRDAPRRQRVGQLRDGSA